MTYLGENHQSAEYRCFGTESAHFPLTTERSEKDLAPDVCGQLRSIIKQMRETRMKGGCEIGLKPQISGVLLKTQL